MTWYWWLFLALYVWGCIGICLFVFDDPEAPLVSLLLCFTVVLPIVTAFKIFEDHETIRKDSPWLKLSYVKEGDHLLKILVPLLLLLPCFIPLFLFLL